jgi:hypothetical protein
MRILLKDLISNPNSLEDDNIRINVSVLLLASTFMTKPSSFGQTATFMRLPELELALRLESS